MKRIIFAIGMVCIVLGSCKKKNNGCTLPTTTAADSEILALKQELISQGINATQDSHGFFYKINTAGSGDKPDLCSSVTVNYTGKLMDGSVFDANNNMTFSLGKLIIGWQEGIPLIAKGGSIELYIPPSLAYGNTAQGGIPANSNLIFQIDLLNVQ